MTNTSNQFLWPLFVLLDFINYFVLSTTNTFLQISFWDVNSKLVSQFLNTMDKFWHRMSKCHKMSSAFIRQQCVPFSAHYKFALVYMLHAFMFSIMLKRLQESRTQINNWAQRSSNDCYLNCFKSLTAVNMCKKSQQLLPSPKLAEIKGSTFVGHLSSTICWKN